jgi:serine/threonine-protein kinase
MSTALPIGFLLGPYEILGQLGAGGMGEVYKARDTRLDRLVAIKVAKEQFSDRFQREAKAIAALNHPHICVLYDIGPNYLVMEYVEGKPMRGPLPLEQVLLYASQIASALEAAHAKNIIHRDLKPGNILVTAAGVKLLDFGLAKFATAPSADGETLTEGLTQAGAIVGTIAYMSPEQAAGHNIDPRSDLFSFGAVLYEALTGARAFQGSTPVEILTSLIRNDPKPVRDLRQETPASMERIISRCLAKEPDQRFPTAVDLTSALRKALTPTPATSSIPSLAVLPFVNLNRDEEGEFFADGITEDIISMLTKLDGLRVASRSLAFQHKVQTLGPQEIGARLGVSTLIEGTVRRAGKRLRVTVEMVNVSDGFPIWSEKYDRVLDDIFDIQDEITNAIIEKLKLQFKASSGEPLVRHYTDNVEAYQHYLKGRFQLNKRTAAGCFEARKCFEQALALDSSYALAYSGLADVLSVSALYMLIPHKGTLGEARQAASRALALDDALAEAHASMAFIACLFDHDFNAGDRGFQQAIALNPHVSSIHHWYGFILACMGRFDEAIVSARRARALDPVTPIIGAGEPWTLTCSGRIAESVPLWDNAYSLDPAHPLLNFSMAVVAGVQGRHDDVRAHIRVLPSPWNKAIEAWHHAILGEPEQARKIAATIPSNDQIRNANLFAIVAAGLGDEDKLIEWLEISLAEREPTILFWLGLPFFEKYRRQSPRFIELLRQHGITA